MRDIAAGHSYRQVETEHCQEGLSARRVLLLWQQRITVSQKPQASTKLLDTVSSFISPSARQPSFLPLDGFYKAVYIGGW